jgi:hypothetical protein
VTRLSFILFKTFILDLRPPSLLLNAQRYSSSGVKRPGREAEQPPPSSVEVTNEWSYASTPPVCIHGGERESFTFTRWAAFLMSDIFTVTWHHYTFCRYHLIILILCVQFMYSWYWQAVTAGALWIYNNLQANHWKDPTVCTGKFHKPALLRSYFVQYCNSVPQIFTVMYLLVMNQENLKCIACTSNSLLFNGYRASPSGLIWLPSGIQQGRVRSYDELAL